MHSIPYQAGTKYRQFAATEIDKMLKRDVIKPETTEWASLILFAFKNDVSISLCVDYRKVNAITVRDSYPLSRVDECIESLGEGTIFSTLGTN